MPNQFFDQVIREYNPLQKKNKSDFSIYDRIIMIIGVQNFEIGFGLLYFSKLIKRR